MTKQVESACINNVLLANEHSEMDTRIEEFETIQSDMQGLNINLIWLCISPQDRLIKSIISGYEVEKQ